MFSSSQDKQFRGSERTNNPLKALQKHEEVSDEDDECGDTDEHIIHAAAAFNPSSLMSASDSGATSSS